MHSTSAAREINASIAPQRRKRVGTRFPGILQDSAALGMNRTQLWLVLTGERPDPAVITRYTQLLTNEGRTIPSNLGQAA